MLAFTPEEQRRRAEVVASIREAVRLDQRIVLGGTFYGEVGAFCYQFEGEDDLLHVAVTRKGGDTLSPEEGQAVVEWLLPGMPPGLVWIRPGEFSQHFYCGHDDLVANVLA